MATYKEKKRVYLHEADWLIANLAWCNVPGEQLRLVISSYTTKQCRNQIQIVHLERDYHGQNIEVVANFDHLYPPTKLAFMPIGSATNPGVNRRNLLATSSDYLRIWSFDTYEFLPNETQPLSFKENRPQTLPAPPVIKSECKLCPNYRDIGSTRQSHNPVTSFDWNVFDPELIVTSTIDSTCALWNVELQKELSSRHSLCSNSTKITNDSIANEKHIYDVAFTSLASGREIVALVGSDGALRLVDTRDPQSTSTLYAVHHDTELKGKCLSRVACNKLDPKKLATFADDSNIIVIADIRVPGNASSRLVGHNERLNGLSWAPHSSRHLCSASDDRQVLIWELSKPSNCKDEPILTYHSSDKVNAIGWSPSNPDWIAIAESNNLKLLRV